MGLPSSLPNSDFQENDRWRGGRQASILVDPYQTFLIAPLYLLAFAAWPLLGGSRSCRELNWKTIRPDDFFSCRREKCSAGRRHIEFVRKCRWLKSAYPRTFTASPFLDSPGFRNELSQILKSSSASRGTPRIQPRHAFAQFMVGS